jgi:serine/threonine protein phosphatase PrpC
MSKIMLYGFSEIGSSHLKTEGQCQDASKFCLMENGLAIAAIADGVGSCKYSDIASRIAVDISVQVCLDEIGKNNNKCDLLKVIEKAFIQAETEIDKYSLSKKHLITDYDTTLSLVIYDGKYITYGHCGDGGIIGLTNTGDYVKVTTPQKTNGIYVVPIRDGKKRVGKDAWEWEIGRKEDEFASILLATDGVYDIFFPYLLKGQSVEIYVPVIRYFMDNNILEISDETRDFVEKKRKDYLNSAACASITDDKTIVVLINGNIHPKLKEKAYYAEPDWNTLQLEWNKKAYPHLYEKMEYTSKESEISDLKSNDNMVNETTKKKEEPIKNEDKLIKQEESTKKKRELLKKIISLITYKK